MNRFSRHPPVATVTRSRRAGLRIFNRRAFGLAVLCAILAYSTSSQALSQAQIGAAFIFNFAKFTEWPSRSFVDSGSPITVCFLGGEDYRSAFRGISDRKAINGRWIIVRELKSAGEVRDCQIVYADSSNNAVIVEVLKNARQSGALAIGSSEDFLTRGGTIRLLVESNRMRFDVNVGAAGRTKIHLSSKLLALARSVVDLPDPAAN